MGDPAKPQLYPRYCFQLAPTLNTWCFMHARDIHNLDRHEGFEGENFFFFGNLPIKWVRLVGVVVAIEEFTGRRVYTIDDSGGACIECIVSLPSPVKDAEANARGKNIVVTEEPTEEPGASNTSILASLVGIRVGSVIDVKGGLSIFRDEKQVNIEKVTTLRCTAQEVVLWKKRSRFRQEVLDQPWILRNRDIRRCRKEAEQNEAKAEMKQRRLEALISGQAARDPMKPLAGEAKRRRSTNNERASSSKKDTNVEFEQILRRGGNGLTVPNSHHHHHHAAFHKAHIQEKRGAAETSDLQTTYAKSDIIPVTETVKVVTTEAATGAVLIPASLSNVEPQTTGFVVTKVDASGEEKEGPLLTKPIPKPTSLLQPLSESGSKKPEETKALVKMDEDSNKELFERASADIFAAPIGTSAPPSLFSKRTDHPVPRLGVVKSGPIGTNKFYSNFYLGTQLGPTYTYPYAVSWAGGTGASASWGLSISHVEASQFTYGPVEFNNAASYYINPVGIQSMVISAKELGKSTVLTLDAITAFSARVNLKKDSSSAPAIQFPLVQGMPYVTAIFNGATPQIQTGVYFKTMTKVTKDPKSNVSKYNFVLEDGTTWRLYAYKTKGNALSLKLTNNGLALASGAFYGTIQIAKDPKTSGSEALLDDGAGIYATTVKLTGSVSGSVGTYNFKFARAGHPTGNIYMFALPHHTAVFDTDSKRRTKTLQMQTPTKGKATLVLGSLWTMSEPSLPTSMGLDPWSATKGPKKALSTSAKAAIKSVAQVEISQDIQNQVSPDSMYFSGKTFAKFGQIVYVLQDMLGEKGLAQAGLAKLKTSFATFVTNKQKYPLVYESAWGGVVSSASYATGDSGSDFGNTYYNDHHFHYGYHVLTAAYIGYYDKTWLAANKAYVQTLIRDYANPSASDPYFPQFRSFDWYHGHSWAHGLFASWDGKDQESSSEDVMSAYALLIWGKVIKDADMIARAQLQLAIQARAMRIYYLYTSDNTNQPSKFIGNKVAGILFENKIHHTTYFDDHIESIQGIHMIPVIAPSAYIRSNAFVTQEWNTFFASGKIDKIANAWKSIIYASYANVDPVKAWNYFSSKSFNTNYIDGGASQTWYMAYSAALGGL
ncbi:glycosyl hydrolase [Mariannaea sp. PMI_226]|nr:glycosyl hydrolase [Mariannaea sp. PMI_226]